MSTPADPSLLAALSDAALKAASSESLFRRGEVYARSGAVQTVEQDHGPVPAARATVIGTQAYQAEVWLNGGTVAGRCNCPHAADGWFCKHQVALALTWRGSLGGGRSAYESLCSEETEDTEESEETERGGRAAKRVHWHEDRRDALAAFLRGQDPQGMAQRLLDLADRDPAIERELQQWRKLSEARHGSAGPSELKALATQILATGRDFLDWREAPRYAQRAADILPLLAQTRARHPEHALALGLHALRRIWAALEQADDSGGDIVGLACAIGDEWVEALRAAGARPAAFGDRYLQLLLDDPGTSFDAAAAEAAMGASARDRFMRSLAARWRSAKDAVLAAREAHAAKVAEARRRKRREPYYDPRAERPAGLLMLEQLYLRRLEAEGDVDGALAVLRAGLPDPSAYAAVTTFLERHGRLREAFANADTARRAHPDDDRLQQDLLRCYERDGWVDEALALRRARFEKRPGVEAYCELLRACAAAGRDVDALRAELHAVLVAREQPAAPHPRDRGSAPAPDVTLRTEVLCAEQRWVEALAVVQPPARCQPGTLQMLARHLGNEHRAQRIALLQRVLMQAMRSASSPYRDELKLVEDIGHLLDSAERAAWLNRLRAEFRAKRNFIAGLPAR